MIDAIERRLKALDFDGVGANLKCVLDCAAVPEQAYERVLSRLRRCPAALPEEQARIKALEGKILFNLGRYQEARLALAESAGLDGGRPRVRCWIGALDLMEGRYARAVEELSIALRADGDCAWAYFYRAAAYHAMGLRRPARRDLRRLLAGGARGAPVLAARVFWALLQARQGRWREAFGAAGALRARCPDEAWPYALRAAFHAERGRLLRAAADASAAIERGGDRLRLHALRADFLAQAGEAGAAAADLRKALGASWAAEQVRPLCFELARRFEKQGRCDRARAVLRDALGKYPRDVELHLGLARHLDNSGRRAEAAAALRRGRILLRAALRARPDSAQLWLAQAQAAAHLRDFTAAETAARRLLEIARRPRDPLFYQARLTCVDVLMAQGAYARAQKVLRRALALEPQWGEGLILLARGLLKSGRIEEGLRLLDEVPHAAETIPIRLEAGRMSLGQGDLRRADGAVKPVEHLLEGNYEALVFLGRLRLRQRRLSQARRAYEAAWALRPDQWRNAFPLAEILLRGGKLRRMRMVLERARRLAAGGRDVGSLVGRLRLALCLGRCREAAGLGEAILDRTRRFDDLDPLYRPALIDLDDFKGYRISAAYRRAIKRAFERDMARRPRSPWSYYYYRQFGDKFVGGDREWEAHARCLEKLKAFPVKRYGWMRYHMGLDLLYDRRFRPAIEQFRLAVRYSRGEDWRSQCLIGEAFLCLGDLKAALAAFAAALKASSPRYHGYILAWKGEVLLWAGRYSQALRVLQEVIDGGDPVPLAACWKGGALLKLGRRREALRVLDTAAATRSDQEARVWRGEALYRLGRFRQALAEADSVKRASVVPNFYGRVIAALARGSLGDEAGMLREYGRIPREVLDYAGKKEALGDDASAAGARRRLEAVLELSLGVRRGNYETAVWMR